MGLIEWKSDIISLVNFGLSQEEIEGYLDFYGLPVSEKPEQGRKSIIVINSHKNKESCGQ